MDASAGKVLVNFFQTALVEGIIAKRISKEKKKKRQFN